MWCRTTDCSKVKNRGHPVFCKQSIFPANNRLLGGKTDQCRLVRGEQPMNNRLFGKTDQALNGFYLLEGYDIEFELCLIFPNNLNTV